MVIDYLVTVAIQQIVPVEVFPNDTPEDIEDKIDKSIRPLKKELTKKGWDTIEVDFEKDE